MPAASRALLIVLVILVGGLAGFLSYRGSHQTAKTLPPEALAPAAARQPDTASSDSGAADAASPEQPRPIPDTVPELKLPNLAGQERSLRDFLGHPLIINFWATWCAPCRREIPLLQQLRHAHHADGLEIVGIAVDFRDAVAAFVHGRPIDYPLLVGEDRGLAAAEQFGMQTVLPFSVFADAQGHIVAVKVGELHRDEADFILGTMRSLAAGRLSLPQAHADIAQRLRELAIERAKAGDNNS